MIELLREQIIYENPKPHVHSRQGFFPGLVQAPSGDLLALFVLGEAFEAPNSTTVVSRSKDQGKTWQLEGPLYDKSALPVVTSDAMKPAVLNSGQIVAMGYRFYRQNEEDGIGIEATGGVQHGEDIISFSADEGRTWTQPEIIPRSYPELLEISGPCVQLDSGDLVVAAAPFKMPDGANPSGPDGIVLHSSDGGRTWDDRTRFFGFPSGRVAPLESRLCRLPGERLACLTWAYDYAAERSLTNHVVFSNDGGKSWTEPLDTSHQAQASNLIWIEDDVVLTIHAHRSGSIGIALRLVDMKGNRWRVIEERMLWGDVEQSQDPRMIRMLQELKFGQPSLLKLAGGDVLAAWWQIEGGQSRIKAQRLRLR